MHRGTSTSMQYLQRDFGGAKREEPKLRGQTPGFKSGLHHLPALRPLGRYVSLLVGDYTYRGMFGIWWTQLMLTMVIMQGQDITVIIRMIF